MKRPPESKSLFTLHILAMHAMCNSKNRNWETKLAIDAKH
jgi:hypothetical protein